MAEVRLEKIYKHFDEVVAVDDFNLSIQDKEFVVLVGPSGCGKTTTLRMIAGLESITSGNIYMDERLINRLPAKDRNVAMVFQNYALYPHMSVRKNMSFSLEMRRMPKDYIKKRIQETAELLGIENLLDRRPKQLSGGQRQRVALGRAIVRVPQVYLFDEPLSNLDAKLRIHMRLELKKLHQKMQTTSVYVTHDQIEAMTMGDRIVVMKDGLIQQVGEPLELYFRPANRFVASFIGSPTMNFISAQITGTSEELTVASGGLTLPIPPERATALEPYLNKDVLLGIRPDDFSTASSVEEKGTMKASVAVVQPVGSQIYLDVKIGGNDIIASVDARTRVRARQEIILKAQLENLHFFDTVSEKAIH